jgi:hypothetical protein
VLHPTAGADTPAATLLVALPADGPLVPAAAVEVAGAGAGFHLTADAAYVTTQTWGAVVTTGVHRFELATLAPTGSGNVDGSVAGPFGLSEHEGHLRVATTAAPTTFLVDPGPAVDVVAPPAEADPLAEVVVLDLDGDLDVIGRSGRFGHAGETVHGVRFVGDTAYVVTFLQTDPFWVLDLSEPTAPAVVGTLEIPGFSAYLHPLDDDYVVGFGPDGSGKVAARLFDVGDPVRPAVVAELRLGDDSPVAWDHHAFVDLEGGRFAVPVTTYPQVVAERCPAPLPASPEPRPVGTGIGDGSSSSPGTAGVDGCAPVFEGGSTGVAVLSFVDGRLSVTAQPAVRSDGSFTAERALPAPGGGWVLVGWDRLVDTDGGELALPTMTAR